MASPTDLYTFLETQQIPYVRIDHPPVFTCEEAAVHLKGIDGAGSKNLFLRTKKGDRFLLLAVPESKRVNLKAWAKRTGFDSLGFGSPAELIEYLGVEAGSVTLLAIISDIRGKVEVFVDEELWASELIQSHPLINTSTLLMTPVAIAQFFRALNKTYTVCPVPRVIK